MSIGIQQNVIDPELMQWIIPIFSVTKPDDRLVAGMVMMATVIPSASLVAADSLVSRSRETKR